MSTAISFHVATSEDAPDICRLLREIPVGGDYALSFERGADPFADALPPERHAFVIARDGPTGAAVGLCERSVRPAYVAGRRVLLPYLGARRIAPSHRPPVAILKGGFATLRDQVEKPDEHPVALTSIAADNAAAKRILTAGVKGLPRYEPLGDYATLMMRPRGTTAPDDVSEAGEADREELDQFLGQVMPRRSFAPCLRSAMIDWPMLLLRRAGRIIGCAGIWDQRAYRQAVIRRYPRGIRFARPFANLVAPIAGWPKMPRLGEPIPQAFLSPLALADEADEASLLTLVGAALARARSLGFGVLTVGMAADHPWRAMISRRWRSAEYRTSLYGVHWGGGGAPPLIANDALPMPEVALL